MTPEQKAAYVQAQTMAAYAEIEGMKAVNIERQDHGHSLAYSEGAFLEVIEKYGLHHNTLMTLFHH